MRIVIEVKKENKDFRSFYQNIVDLIIKQEKFITNKLRKKGDSKTRREKIKRKLKSTLKNK